MTTQQSYLEVTQLRQQLFFMLTAQFNLHIFSRTHVTSTCLHGSRASLVLLPDHSSHVAIRFKHLTTRLLKITGDWSTPNHCWNLQNVWNNYAPTCLLIYSACPLFSTWNNSFLGATRINWSYTLLAKILWTHSCPSSLHCQWFINKILINKGRLVSSPAVLELGTQNS